MRNYIKAFPAILLYKSSNYKHVVEKDVLRFIHYTNYNEFSTDCFVQLMNENKRFRTIFYFRVRDGDTVLLNLCKRLLPPLDTIEINGRIGAGFMIHHSKAVICPWKAGSNLTVLPGAVIGRGHKRRGSNRIRPMLGDNVFIGANATVIGGINVGNNVIVGAGAVVTKDIPENSIVAGNPARILKMNNIEQNITE